MGKDKILLATEKKGIAARAKDGRVIGGKMEADGDPGVSDKGTQLLNTSNAIKSKLDERKALQAKAKGLTGELNGLRRGWGKDYKAAADKAQEIYPDNAPKWTGYGFALADIEPSDRPIPDKVENLQVTPGGEAGEGDLVWNAQPRGTNDGYFIEVNPTDPIDRSSWGSASPRSVSKSKATITGLTTGQKYWVRVIAFIGSGEGPPSDPKAFIAP